MRELGRKGGKARRAGVAEQLPEAERESLRQHLRSNLDHDVILAAVQQTLAGGNESARVACIRFLADLELYRKDDERELDRGAEQAANAEKFGQLIRDRATRLRRSGKGLVDVSELDAAAREIWDRRETLDGVVVAEVSSADARATLQGLAERGLIRGPQTAAERDALDAKDAEIKGLKIQLSEFTGVAA